MRRAFSNFSKNIDAAGPKFDMKYFITRTTILRVYREALQMAYKVQDLSMRDSMIELMKDEFRPFKMARQNKQILK